MATVDDWVKHRLAQGQSPKSIIANLRAYGIKREDAEQAVQGQLVPKTMHDDAKHHKISLVEALLITFVALFLVLSGYKLGQEAMKMQSSFDPAASYAAKIEYFSGTLTGFSQNSWTLETEKGKTTIVNEGKTLPSITIKTAGPLANSSAVLEIGDSVTIYTLTEQNTKIRQVTGIVAER